MREFYHKPVLLEECIEYLEIKPDGIYIDGTTGGGGHSSQIYKRLDKRGTLIGIDRDVSALEATEQRLSSIEGQARIILEKENYRNMRAVCEKNRIESVDGVLLDIGVSSQQLDEAERGFSYKQDSPLDMRMDQAGALTAQDIVNDYEPERIRQIISRYGEERWASRIADFIAKARKTKRITTSSELVDIIKAAVPASARREGPHPAKRTFQALRIAVNDELGALEEGISEAIDILKSGGRLCVITFHSLEDRIVKKTFKKNENPCICPAEFPICTCGRKQRVKIITKRPIKPTGNELDENPRARSAGLRVAEKV
jgi:16S rRNA (cytosine1402-N4)-methyltransferase